jgi:teichoic acid glycerol-phosphate primase
MLKEFLIWCYLAAYQLVNTLFQFCSVQRKITFVISFEDNAHYVYQELAKHDQAVKIILLLKASVSAKIQEGFIDATVIPYKRYRLVSWILSVYHLSTSKFVIVDNYYAFLSSIQFKKEVECIQIWHAAGALKTFGLKDKSIVNRSKRANNRFRNVYRQFHKIVVGSEEMATIFKDAFGAGADNILRTGIPRTDFFYDETQKEKIRVKLYQQYPEFKDKKVILYAPTYRDGKLKDDRIHLDVQRMYDQLKNNYILLIKTHPAVESNSNAEVQYPGFVYNFSTYKNVNHLLLLTDYLITDYSSIPFEFALLQKPMIFFPYDYETYKEQRGLISDYNDVVPGPVVLDTDQVINAILEDNYSEKLIHDFSSKWNLYSTGNASKQLVAYMVNKLR